MLFIVIFPKTIIGTEISWQYLNQPTDRDSTQSNLILFVETFLQLHHQRMHAKQAQVMWQTIPEDDDDITTTSRHLHQASTTKSSSNHYNATTSDLTTQDIFGTPLPPVADPTYLSNDDDDENPPSTHHLDKHDSDSEEAPTEFHLRDYEVLDCTLALLKAFSLTCNLFNLHHARVINVL